MMGYAQGAMHDVIGPKDFLSKNAVGGGDAAPGIEDKKERKLPRGTSVLLCSLARART